MQFVKLVELAEYLRNELGSKKFILLYAHNGTGKTRLSGEFKNIGKRNYGGMPDTLYFNAFTEDLFYWDNDLEYDRQRVLKMNARSRFFDGLREVEMNALVRPLLRRYAGFDFQIDKVNDDIWEVAFSRDVLVGERLETIEDIKISRGEENIFIWCFFLAIVELALDGAEAYSWVKYIYIDDPISSLDEHNAIAVANHLAKTLKRQDSRLKAVISTHHTLFFNVLCNELKNANRYYLSRTEMVGYTLTKTCDTPFFHHVATLAELYEAGQSGRLYTHHFNMLRSILEKTASFHGHKDFSACLKKDPDDADAVLHTRLINILSHGNYSLFEPQEMLEENKEYFRKILRDFITRYPFNPTLFPREPETVANA